MEKGDTIRLAHLRTSRLGRDGITSRFWNVGKIRSLSVAPRFVLVTKERRRGERQAMMATLQSGRQHRSRYTCTLQYYILMNYTSFPVVSRVIRHYLFQTTR